MKKKIYSLILVFTLIMSTTLTTLAKNSVFKDVDDNAWYGTEINTMAKKGMVLGVGGGKYNPKGIVTRAEYMALLLRIYNGKDLDSSKTDTTWMDKYIKKAEELKLVKKQDSKFWTAPIPRAEVAHYMNTLFQLDDITASQLFEITLDGKKTDLSSVVFKDIKGTDYEKDICAVAGKVMIGEKKGDDFYFRPDRTLSRAEIAIIVYNLFTMKYDNSTYKNNAELNSIGIINVIKLAKAINNKNTNIINNDALDIYNNHFNNKPITKIKMTTNSITNSYDFIISNDSGTDLTIDPYSLDLTNINDNAKNLNELLKKYTEALKKEDTKTLLSILQNIPSGGSFEIQDAQKLIDEYKKQFDLSTINSKIDSITNTIGNDAAIYSIKVTGQKNGKDASHLFTMKIYFSDVYLYDYFNVPLNAKDIIGQLKTPTIKKVDNISYTSKNNNTNTKQLNNGNYAIVNYSNETIEIKDKNQKNLKTIIMPPSTNNFDISYDGNQIAFSTYRGIYITDIEFKQPKLILANNSDENFKNVHWSKDSKQLFLQMVGYEWASSISIIDVESLKLVYGANLQDYNFEEWIEKENKIIMKFGYEDHPIVILDYKNNILYQNNNMNY